MEKQRWYVFDQYDCLTSAADAKNAAIEAEHFSTVCKMKGVHIVHMSEDQFDHYCTHNDLAEALKVR